jgi:hypothetical protein
MQTPGYLRKTLNRSSTRWSKTGDGPMCIVRSGAKTAALRVLTAPQLSSTLTAKSQPTRPRLEGVLRSVRECDTSRSVLVHSQRLACERKDFPLRSVLRSSGYEMSDQQSMPDVGADSARLTR